ncbi:nitrilase family protein [Flavobacterium glaciei]|uniref:Omega-amidase YafV n=1 Tax=Flavobacterium glaciei TaxID=386300 RepID=A0A562PYK9_9FLAO|nr:nitrilase family protein [Flavobacterium glaciei]RDI56983.1 putative amidohydrolase [Flavobacterium glaciei]TWI49483.1 putative amidohydrolase [Flavobacterium glaciei]
MKIAFIQAPLAWENPKENRAYFESKINEIQLDVQIIVLPEMFTSGFTMNPERVAEGMEGETLSWLKQLAVSRNCAFMGSLVITEGDQFFNRFVFVAPSGNVEYYDKKHLFTLSGENVAYVAGKEKYIIEYLGWKICPLICYDLRFPVFSRNTEDYDLLVYVASWPKTRVNAWDILLQARAVENMCYAVGVNRLGTDGNGYEYVGHSQAVDFLGYYLQEPTQMEGSFVVILNKEKLLETRQKLGFLNDRDAFELKDN